MTGVGASGRETQQRIAGGKHALKLEHLRTSQLKILLSASALSTEGDRESLLSRLKEEVISDVELEWVVHRLHANTPIREDATVVEWDGGLYLFGGKDDSSDIGSQELLHLSHKFGEWKVVENIGTWPERRYAHCAAVHDSKMYVWGGQRDCNSDRYFNDMHCFDFKHRVWHEVKQFGAVPDARSYAKAVVNGKHMLVYGGVDADRGGNGGLKEFSEGHGNVLCFDFESKCWSVEKAGGPPSTKPLPIFIEALAVFNNHLYTLTYDYTKDDASLAMHKLDLDKMKWHKVKMKGTAPSARTRFAEVVMGSQWILHGGLLKGSDDEDGEEDPQNDMHNIPSDECYAFSFDTESWSQVDFIGRGALPRGGHAACELLGSMVLTGGAVPRAEGQEDEDDADGSDGGDDGDASDLNSDDSGYTVDSADSGQEEHLYRIDVDAGEQGGHEPEHSGDDDADSNSSGGHADSASGGGSGSDSMHNADALSLRTVEVLQPRPTGHATDKLVNINLQSRLKQYCCSEDHSDVVLTVEGKRFHAHRLVLSAQSEIFDAMLRGGMKEDSTGEVVVEDMRPEVMKSFIAYLYGCLEAIKPDQAMDLFRASDRYGVESLRSECLHMLQAAVDTQNAAAIAQLADEHQCQELFTACIRFTATVTELPKVVGSASYMQLMRANPELAQKFIRLAAEQQAESCRLEHGVHGKRRRKRRRAL